jgi:uncharacterized protein YjiS (DUF1127 family)
LDDHLLTVIGIARKLAEAESQKPFWRGNLPRMQL